MEKITRRTSPSKQVQPLTLPLTELRGIGPQKAAILAQKGLHNILDLLFFWPTRYEDRTRLRPLDQAREGEKALIKGQMVYGREEGFARSHKRLFRMIIRDETSTLELIWFHYRKQYLTRLVQPDRLVLVYGLIQLSRGRKQIIHPEIIPIEENEIAGYLGFFPVYPALEGLSAQALRKMMTRALEIYLPLIVDPLPGELTRRLGLPTLKEALQGVHHPPPEANSDHLNQYQTLSHQRLTFDRFFLTMLVLIHHRQQRLRKISPVFTHTGRLFNRFQQALPFKLTRDQISAIEDIREDFSRSRPMFRLLLGDVGCGKTAVAATAAYMAAGNKKQTALMTPTRILAKQHLEFFKGLSDQLDIKPLLLVSEMTKKERAESYHQIRTGTCNLVIGTQALIQEDLVFKDLGLVIIDEQQRFGVQHRSLISQKAVNPHQLIMTATPIPRTLAVTLYGDMDLSIIRTRPPGHKVVQTRLVPRRNKREVFAILQSSLYAGRQAFVICPLIEGSEETDLKAASDMAAGLKKILFPHFKVGLVHGRVSADEREKVMQGFRQGQIHVLVGTTVLEVGVDVPNATLMIIEHPERFGLSQLHQLRGRVGRGREQGLCLMVYDENIPPGSAERLKLLEECQDGFQIAEKDLAIRGHGELTGLKQSGLGEIDLQEILHDPELLLTARQEALELIRHDPDLTAPEHKLLKTLVTSILAKPLDL